MHWTSSLHSFPLYELDVKHLKQVCPHEWCNICEGCEVSCVKDIDNQDTQPYYNAALSVCVYLKRYFGVLY